MGCDDEKLSKYLTHTFMAHCHTMICQQVTLSGEAEWPKVADAVIEAEQGVDLILMGTHGRTGLAHVFLGSVAEHVVRQAPCPVLVVRRVPDTSATSEDAL